MQKSFKKIVAFIFIVTIGIIMPILGNQYLQAARAADLKQAYIDRLTLPDKDCTNVQLNDEDYTHALAEKGNAYAQYVYGRMLAKKLPNHYGGSKYVLDGESYHWILSAAKKGDVHAQDYLCGLSAQGSPFDRFGSSEWCIVAAEHNVVDAQSAIAIKYYLGQGTEKDFQKAYFWGLLGDNIMGQSDFLNEVRANLTKDEISQIESKVEDWKLNPPFERIKNKNIEDQLSSLPINVNSLLCGGEASGCRMSDICGDLVGFICPGWGNKKYLFVRASDSTIVSPTNKGLVKFYDIVPDEWTCPSPENMPLSKSEQAKFPKFSKHEHAVSCGKLLGVDIPYVSDGTYRFISKETGETVGTCSFWQSAKTQKPCKPPTEWYCGPPSNYH